MLKKHSVLLCAIISISLLVIATSHYPGGSQKDKNSFGYDWANNYISNLFGEKAMNGVESASRPWAVAGMLFLSASFAFFFVGFSKKIAAKREANIIKYCGAAGMLFAFLAVTPYHDIMITIAGTLTLISMFYITVFVFTSKLHLFKMLSIVCLLSAYCTNYIYYTRNYLWLLPVLQKASLGITIVWALCLQYFTTIADFPIKKKVAKKKEGISIDG